MTPLEIGVALLIAVGLVGIVVPVLPGGSLLVAAAVLLWAWAGPATTTAWLVFAIAAVLVLGGLVVKYVVPGRRLQGAGVPLSTQAVGAVVAVIGFFVVPVIGFFLGFVLGIWLAECRRVGPGRAWASTRQALRAAGLSIMIDLAAALLATAAWVVGVVLT